MKLLLLKKISLIFLASLTLFFVSACRRQASSNSISKYVSVVDSDGKEVAITDSSRVVSISGSVTETVYALSAESKLVGTDTSSIYPEAATKLPQVGYMRQLSAEGVLSLKPTLVLATKDAGPPAVIEQLKSSGVTVLILPSETNPEGARKKIKLTAQALGVEAKGDELIKKLDEQIKETNSKIETAKSKPRVMFVYARGGGAPNVSGTKTAADEMIRLAGGVNAVTEYENYKPLTPEAAVTAAPDFILLPKLVFDSVGGTDGVLKMPGIALTPAGKNRRIIAIDDLLLLGFGPRTGEGIKELAKLLHPEQF